MKDENCKCDHRCDCKCENHMCWSEAALVIMETICFTVLIIILIKSCFPPC